MNNSSSPTQNFACKLTSPELALRKTTVIADLRKNFIKNELEL